MIDVVIKKEQTKLNMLMSYLQKALIWGIIIYGSWIWVGIYMVDIIRSGELFRFVITRHMFYYLQIILSALGIIFIHTAIKHDFTIKNITFYFLLATILVYTRFFQDLHMFLSRYELYFDMFKTNADKTQVVSFQYSRVMMLLFASVLMIGSFALVRATIKKVFLILFTFMFFIFMYNMHLHVGRQTYKDYESNLEVNLNMVVNNYKNYEKLCPDLNLQCYMVNVNDVSKFNLAKPNVINRILNELDTSEESNQVARDLVTKFLESNDEQKVIMESGFITNNLRAVCYGFRRVGDKVFILVDFVNLAYALDLYLIYFLHKKLHIHVGFRAYLPAPLGC